MAKRVEIYFKSENDAESARAKLQTQKVSNISVEKIPDARESDGRVFVANDPTYATGGGVGGNLSGGATAEPFAYTGDATSDDNTPLTYLVTFEVSEANYPDTLVAIKNLNYFFHPDK